MNRLICAIFVLMMTSSLEAKERLYSLNVYGGVMTSNDWDEIILPEDVDFERAYLGAVTLARKVGQYKKKITFEVEGQVVKHFEGQNHWELNALATGRWEPFWWDKYVDTSLAFGIGPSYATKRPEVEKQNDTKTSHWLVYWMLELALSPPKDSRWAVITRIHHRSNAWGLVADKGGSNAVVVGVKWRL